MSTRIIQKCHPHVTAAAPYLERVRVALPLIKVGGEEVRMDLPYYLADKLSCVCIHFDVGGEAPCRGVRLMITGGRWGVLPWLAPRASCSRLVQQPGLRSLIGFWGPLNNSTVAVDRCQVTLQPFATANTTALTLQK